MNVENTKKVLAAIEVERGARFDMKNWGFNPRADSDESDSFYCVNFAEHVTCNTSMCLAGWANYLSFGETKENPRLDNVEHAAKWLGMKNFRRLAVWGDHEVESPFNGAHNSDAALDSLRKCVRDRSWSKYLDYIKEYDCGDNK